MRLRKKNKANFIAMSISSMLQLNSSFQYTENRFQGAVERCDIAILEKKIMYVYDCYVYILIFVEFLLLATSLKSSFF